MKNPSPVDAIPVSRHVQSGESGLRTAREELAEQESRLINALLGLAPAPAEVNPNQIEICGLSLKRKRARTLARFSGVQNTTGSLEPDMERYFKEHPGVHPNGPCADFSRYQKFTSRGLFHKFTTWIKQWLSGP